MSWWRDLFSVSGRKYKPQLDDRPELRPFLPEPGVRLVVNGPVTIERPVVIGQDMQTLAARYPGIPLAHAVGLSGRREGSYVKPEQGVAKLILEREPDEHMCIGAAIRVANEMGVFMMRIDIIEKLGHGMYAYSGMLPPEWQEIVPKGPTDILMPQDTLSRAEMVKELVDLRAKLDRFQELYRAVGATLSDSGSALPPSLVRAYWDLHR